MCIARSVTIILILLSLALPSSSQDQRDATISGTVYDRSGAVIPGIRILIENTSSGVIQNLHTNAEGQYRASVSPARYRVIRQPSAGYPIPYQHASFQISAGEGITINFRPIPFSISDSIENGKWIERYEGDLPINATYYVRSSDGTIKDLQIQYYEIKNRGGVLEHKYSVTASFDKLTVYADKAILDGKSRTLLAEGDVTLEDGQQVYKVKGVRLDLSKEPVGINLMKDK